MVVVVVVCVCVCVVVWAGGWWGVVVAVNGVVVGTNVPTRQAIKAPIMPPNRNKVWNSGCDQENTAEPKHSSNRMPVLLTIPGKVMARDSSPERSRSQLRFNNGFDDSMAGNLRPRLRNGKRVMAGGRGA